MKSKILGLILFVLNLKYAEFYTLPGKYDFEMTEVRGAYLDYVFIILIF